MSSAPAVVVRDLTKSYRVYASPWERLRALALGQQRGREFRALDGVSFELPRGEGLGIIGENGAGKSTLLKILAGVATATAGSVSVEGKVASILELGAGFHPEFTGRQNISLNAALLGLSPAELRRKLPDIVAFSELGEFIDQPVKVYSTGMTVRLAFSIATQVDPEVLIIDEALSVGDGYFQKKCMDRLARFVDGGGTLLFCSHAMYYVSAFCQRALWLRHGRIEALGPAADVVRAYENFLVAKSGAATAEAAPAAAETPTGPVRITAVRIGGDEAAPRLYGCGEAWEVEVEWESADPGLAFHVGIGVNRLDGLEVCAFATHFEGLSAVSGDHAYTARLLVPRLPLVKGEFMLYVFVLDEEGLHIYDQRLIRPAFDVESPDYRFGLVRVDHRWQLEVARPTLLASGRTASG